jgi:hypothetical protein
LTVVFIGAGAVLEQPGGPEGGTERSGQGHRLRSR